MAFASAMLFPGSRAHPYRQTAVDAAAAASAASAAAADADFAGAGDDVDAAAAAVDDDAIEVFKSGDVRRRRDDAQLLVPTHFRLGLARVTRL